jgi:hypothetical protein
MANPLTDVIIQSLGTYQDTHRTVEVRTAQTIASDFNLNTAAIGSISNISLMNSFETDSYSGGVYDPLNPGYNGHVFSQGNRVSLKSGSIIRGHLYANPGATFNTGEPANGEVYWKKSHETSSTDQSGEILSIENFALISVPPHLQMSATPTVTLTSGGSYTGGHYLGNTNLTDITFSGGFYKITGPVGIKSNKKWTLTGNCDIYVTGDVTFANGAEFVNYVPTPPLIPVVTSYTVRLFVDGDVTFSQGDAVNVNGNFTPSKLQIYGTGSLTHTIDMKNSGIFMGFVYAPNYKVNFNNAVEAFGSFSVYSINPKYDSKIHFDERLWNLNFGAPLGKYPIANWREV